jgi:hypothetical protein
VATSQSPELREEVRRLQEDLSLAIKRNDEAARAAVTKPGDAVLAGQAQIACEKVERNETTNR